MSYYARFLPAPGVPGGFVRHDTRIYLNGSPRDQSVGTPVGAVVAKNPGSATPGLAMGTWGPLVLGRDKLLRDVRSIFLQAYAVRRKAIPELAYVQVFNLCYFCAPVLSVVKGHLRAGVPFPLCPMECRAFPLLWFLWGPSDTVLNPEKPRFLSRPEPKQFFYDTSAKGVVPTAPGLTDPARHTQGMTHGLIVPYISTII